MNRNLPSEASEIGRALERLAKTANIYPPGSEQRAAGAAVLDAVKASIARGTEAVAPSRRNYRHLEGGELHRSFAAAVVGLARVVSSGLYTATDLRELVLDHVPLPDLAFWTTQSAGHMRGLLEFEEDVRKLIEAEGVKHWIRWEDQGIRIVNTRWLEAHADIRAWVLEPWPGGYTCRFCGMKENARVSALEQVELTRRQGERRIGETVVLEPGRGSHTHPECRRYWLEWITIASRYASDEAAAAADEQAGRKSKLDRVQVPVRSLPATEELTHE